MWIGHILRAQEPRVARGHCPGQLRFAPDPAGSVGQWTCWDVSYEETNAATMWRTRGSTGSGRSWRGCFHSPGQGRREREVDSNRL